MAADCWLKSDGLKVREEPGAEEASDVVGNEARGAETMVENLHLDLAAVSVTRERKLDAQLGGAMERIGIVGEENVGHVAADEGLNIRQNLLALATGSTLALVIDANQIE